MKSPTDGEKAVWKQLLIADIEFMIPSNPTNHKSRLGIFRVDVNVCLNSAVKDLRFCFHVCHL